MAHKMESFKTLSSEDIRMRYGMKWLHFLALLLLEFNIHPHFYTLLA